MKTIPFCKPTVTKKDITQVLEYMIHEAHNDNEFINRFEKKVSVYLKTPKVLLLNHIASALYLIGRYLQLNEQDEVIVSCLAENFVGEVLKLFNVKTIFVDNSSDSLCMSKEEILKKITDKTKAIIVTHQLGYPFPMQDLVAELSQLKDKRIWLIEDISQGFGTVQKGAPLGNVGDFGISSFSRDRLISLGNGGIVFGKNINALRTIKKLAFITDESNEDNGKLDFSATELQSAMGIAEISLVDKFINKRKEIAEYYTKCLLQSSHIPLFNEIEDFPSNSTKENQADSPDEATDETTSETNHKADYKLNYYAYPVHFKTDLKLVKEMFKKYSIEIKTLENGAIFQNFSDEDIYKSFPNANKQSKHYLCIPIYPTLMKKTLS